MSVRLHTVAMNCPYRMGLELQTLCLWYTVQLGNGVVVAGLELRLSVVSVGQE